jgi:hypothetical protein
LLFCTVTLIAHLGTFLSFIFRNPLIPVPRMVFSKGFGLRRPLTAVALLLLSGTAAFAQQPQQINVPVRGQSRYEDPVFSADVPRGLSVFERDRPDFQPPEIRAGSFFINPAIGLATQYTDNMFASDDDTDEDVLWIANPSVRATSDWSRHALTFRAGAEGATYQDNDKQNYTDMLVGLNGAFDIARGFYVSGGASWQHLHEERSSPNSTVGNQDAPVEFDLGVYNIGLIRKVGLIGFELGFDTRRWEYDNTDAFNNDTRDRYEYIGTGTVSYEFMPGYSAFTSLILNQREYDDSVDLQGFQRDSDGWEVRAGANVELTTLVSADIYAGFLEQDYEDARFDTVDGMVFGSSFLWNVTPLTSVRGAIGREVRDSVLANVSSYLQTTYKLSAEHELMRNVLLGASFQYQDLDFEGVSIDRADQYYLTSVGGRYLVTRNVSLGLDYQYQTRATDAANLDFVENIVQAGVIIGF